MDKNQQWQAALGELELLISKANFTTWFKNTFIAEAADDRVVIGVPNGFTKVWLEKKYHPAIIQALKNAGQLNLHHIEYRVETRQPSLVSALADPAASGSAAPVAAHQKNVGGMDAHHTFEDFIVGKGNELARAAARAVADQPGVVYNPLFIYGGVGLGKTHLLQAIGNAIRRQHPELKVLYASSEQFTNDFIQAVSHGWAEKFKNNYRGVDVLLIDDIQFLSNKERTQEEFFHTFNTLHAAKKQIVITSDRPPKSIAELEARLVSRFEWGMIADIAQPDLETRIAILESKCRERHYVLPLEILQHIATVIQNNVRELEGALNRIVAWHDLHHATPSLETVKTLLASTNPSAHRGGLTPKQVVATVGTFFDVVIEDLLGASRKKELVEPRQIAMYLMREELHASFPAIGHELGGRDHTTAMHACSKIAARLQHDEKMKQDLVLLRQRLYGG